MKIDDIISKNRAVVFGRSDDRKRTIGTRCTTYGSGDDIMFIFTHWHATGRGMRRIASSIGKYKSVYIIHTNTLLLRDPHTTLDIFTAHNAQSLAVAHRVISKTKPRSIHIVGISIGCVTAAYVASNLKGLKSQTIDLICPGASLAPSLWTSTRTPFIKKQYSRRNVTLKQLEYWWRDLAPINNLGFVNGNAVRIFYSLADTAIPRIQAQILIEKIRHMHPKSFQVVRNRYLGHYLTLMSVWVLWARKYGKVVS